MCDVTFGPMDPADDDIFTVTWIDALDASDTLSVVNSVAVDTASDALNISAADGGIVADPDSGTANKANKFTLGVALANHEHADFEKYGHTCVVTINVTTTSGRVLERNVKVPIRQT